MAGLRRLKLVGGLPCVHQRDGAAADVDRGPDAEPHRLQDAFQPLGVQYGLELRLRIAHWDTVKPVVQAKIVAMEASFAEQLATMDATAAKIMTQHGTAAAVEALTNFTIRTGDGLVDDWNIFFGELFVRFGDGFDASPTPRSAKQTVSEPYINGGTSTVDVKETRSGYWVD